MLKTEKLISELQTFFQNCGFTRAVVGLSGGIDSAVTLAVAVRALGAKNVTGILLPDSEVSSSESEILAKKVAVQFDVQTYTFELAPTLATLNFEWGSFLLAEQNIRPRLRMLALYHFARTHNALVLGTSNRSEILLGYGTKFGDFAADVEVIGDFWKTEVYQLALEFTIPSEIINRSPTAELQVGVTDEHELGANYATIDPILQKIVAGESRFSGDSGVLEKRIYERVLANSHKTKLPPVLGQQLKIN